MIDAARAQRILNASLPPGAEPYTLAQAAALNDLIAPLARHLATTLAPDAETRHAPDQPPVSRPAGRRQNRRRTTA